MSSSSRGWLPARSGRALLPALAILLGAACLGCASARDLLGGMLPGESKPSPYYVEIDSLPVYRTPGRHVLARLPRNERVLRSRLEKGWAFVRVEATGLEGWVDNSKLAWRPQEAGGAEPSGALAEEPEAPALPAEPAAQPEPAPGDAKPQQEGETRVPPSVFDPY